MRWRWVVGGLLLVAAVVATIVMDPSTFTVEETVGPAREGAIEPEDLAAEPTTVEVTCTRSGPSEVVVDGETIDPDELGPTSPSLDSVCGAARSDNQRRGVNIAMVLALAAIGLLFLGPLYNRVFDRHPRTAYRGIE
jgi:hypothetical protein